MRRVLVVDDDEAFGEQLVRSLTRRGFHSELAVDGRAALRRVSTEPPDAVLLDLRLAGESGLDLVPRLRALNSGMVIVLLTGYASVATAVEAIKRGADDYLPKPSSLDSIVRALRGMPVPNVESGDAPSEMLPLQRVEWEHMQQALTETGGNISAAARLLGVHRRTLQRKLGKRPQPDSREQSGRTPADVDAVGDGRSSGT